jgi:Domain of unknown function (DUF4262)
MSDHTHDEYCGCPSTEVVMHSCKENIAEYGWSSIGVTGERPFFYTIGLYESYGLPEFAIAGLPANIAHGVVSQAVALARETPFVDGDVSSDILVGYEARLRAVESDEFSVANVHYGHRDTPFLQIIWPDANGCFPGDEGVDEEIAACQQIS